jgi:hypothetical protein
MRLEKAGRFVEIWLEDGTPCPVLWRRDGDDPTPRREPLRFEFTARRQFTELCAEYLGTGWRRVDDPLREPAAVEEPWAPALAEALRAGDLEAACVLGDALQLLGHPRGALIAIQTAREARPDDPELAAQEARLFEEHGAVLVGALAPHIGTRGAHHDRVLELAWRRGFIERARIDGYFDRGESEEVLATLFRHPSGRFLRELEIGCHHAGDQDNTLMAALIVSADPAPPLRRLFLGDFDDTQVDQIDISRAPLGDVSGLGQRYPLLEDVILKGMGSVGLGSLALPRAKRFAIRTSTLQRATLDAVVRATWPALEDLELWFGDEYYGADCTADDMPALLRLAAPALRTLRLMNAPFTDELVPHLVSAPLARTLEVLDLSLGTLTGAGADQLIAHARVFERLQRLVVYDCALDDASLERMRVAGLPVDETPCTPAEATFLGWRLASAPHSDPRRRPRSTQKTSRFVSVCE